MDDARQPSPTSPGGSRPAALLDFEQALDEGIDDLEAGRTVSQEESIREMEALLSSYEKKKRTP